MKMTFAVREGRKQMPHIKGMIEFDCDFDALAEDLERNGYVKVVRCKDCLFWNEIPSNTVAPEYHKCKLLGIQMAAYDFCSRGRREP